MAKTKKKPAKPPAVKLPTGWEPISERPSGEVYSRRWDPEKLKYEEVHGVDAESIAAAAAETDFHIRQRDLGTWQADSAAAAELRAEADRIDPEVTDV